MTLSDHDPRLAWHPVADTVDVPLRHTFQGQLLGRELVLWRADDGHVNVWENRCLHRGVRLSIGVNDGRELVCRYHGWRYANRSAGCTYIPAHPADAPARTICNRTFASVERYGLLWTSEDPTGEIPTVSVLADNECFGLRSLPINAPAERVMIGLEDLRFQPNGALDGDEAQMVANGIDPFAVCVQATQGAEDTLVVYFVQPVDAGRSVIRPVMVGAPAASEESAVLRHHNTVLSAFREITEEESTRLPRPEPMEVAIEKVPIHLAQMPRQAIGRRDAPLRVCVARKWSAGEGIAAFELESLDAQLPTFQAGAHIDVHLPNGLVRQYSLTNGPGELAWYRIGVKLEPESRGGSSTLHESVREGDVLAISEPRNNFPLRRDGLRTVLIAGGIGITPLLAMAQALHHNQLNCELHYFAQSEPHVAFADVLEQLGTCVTLHLGLTIEATGHKLEEILAAPASSEHVYVCGPGPMLETTRRIALASGWPDEAVHFEYFKNTTDLDDSSTFEISLARSALTLQVASGETILDVLQANGVAIASSCEQGACGTCSVNVLDGEPDHQDVYLSDTEKDDGHEVMVCVSRAHSDRLVLDI
jgi:ferredoxin-NADP reductase/nitrite reductase/ring-hydroxylating ferredoxin subunit